MKNRTEMNILVYLAMTRCAFAAFRRISENWR